MTVLLSPAALVPHAFVPMVGFIELCGICGQHRRAWVHREEKPK